MRHLGKVSIALVVLVSACNMYGEKAQRMRNPVPIQPTLAQKEQMKKEAEVVIVDLPDCEYHERAMPVPTKPSKQASELERTGDAQSQVFTKASDINVKKDALIDAIDTYGRALANDPFNPDLTLKLARAYEKAQRKGCALALLGRLNKLSNNEKFSKKTEPVINEVLDRKDYFERYRKEAVKALGR